MLEIGQEMAGIMRFVIDHAGRPTAYYWEVPADFAVPSVYFPVPEIETGGDTFLTYRVDYAWHIKFLHAAKEGAYAIGSAVMAALGAARNLVPLIAEDGSEIAGSWVRLNDPALKMLDNGEAQLTLSWRSRRPYNDTAGAQRSQSVHVDAFMKSGKGISDAYILERYAVPLCCRPPDFQQKKEESRFVGGPQSGFTADFTGAR